MATTIGTMLVIAVIFLVLQGMYLFVSFEVVVLFGIAATCGMIAEAGSRILEEIK